MDGRHEFANEWALAFGGAAGKRRDGRGEWGGKGGKGGRGKGGVEFPIRLGRRMFPFLTGERSVEVTTIHVFIELSSRKAKEHSLGHLDNLDHLKLKWLPDGTAKCDETTITCVRETPASTPCGAHADDHESLAKWEKDGKECKCHGDNKRTAAWLYHGEVRLRTEPLEDDFVEDIGRLKFPEGLEGRVKALWFLVGYRVCE
jgi:hypothetical protein